MPRAGTTTWSTRASADLHMPPLLRHPQGSGGGALFDRLGQRKRLIVPALLVNGFVLLMMTGPWPYGMQLLLRFVESCAQR